MRRPRHTPATDPDSVRAAYDRYAWIYDRVFGAPLQDGRRRLERCMAARPGERIVEFGVGSGLMLPLYPPHTEVIGLELSPRMLARAQALVARRALSHVVLRLVNSEDSGIEAGSTDHVVLPYVYSVTPRPQALMTEAFRICRAGGSIWILNHFSGLSAWDWLERPLKPIARWIGFRPDFSYDEYVARQPWQVAHVEPANLFGLSRVVQIRKPA